MQPNSMTFKNTSFSKGLSGKGWPLVFTALLCLASTLATAADAPTVAAKPDTPAADTVATPTAIAADTTALANVASTDDGVGQVKVPQRLKIVYGKASEQQYGVLHIPDGKGPWPLLVLIHGGCWLHSVGVAGYAEPLSNVLAQNGWAVWNIEYRSADDDGGGWPGTFNDVADAVDFTRTLAARYPLDLKRLVIMGHSAGGHLALWAASRDRLPADSILVRKNPLLPRRVISLAGVPDLEPFRSNTLCGSAITTLMGNARMQEISPQQMLPTSMPVTLITARDDFIVPASEAHNYAMAARRLGVKVTEHQIPGIHGTVADRHGLPLQTMLNALAQ